MNTKQIGSFCEQYARDYLEEKGMQILATNFRCREGEIDIIAKEYEYTVFIEVKGRKNTLFGMPGDAVDLSKQRKLIRTAQRYIDKNDCDSAFRFDVVEILYEKAENDIKVKSINHIKGAFEEV